MERIIRGSTYDRAYGRWREILPQLGIDKEFLNGKHQPCPACGGTDRARFTDRTGSGDYFCGQCGAGKGIKLLMRVNGWDFKTATRKVEEILHGTAPLPRQSVPEIFPDVVALRRLWLESTKCRDGDPVMSYLESRMIDMPVPTSLRFVPQMKHPKHRFKNYCGMIAIFSDVNGKPSTIHRTFLTGDGLKADVEPNRLFMAGKLPKGGAIRLGQIAETLGVAEGIETALSAAIIHKIPVWATASEVLLRAWEPPPEVKNVVVFGDHDQNFVGQAAAYDLARRLVNIKKLNVEVKIPKLVGYDFNDVLMEGMQ